MHLLVFLIKDKGFLIDSWVSFVPVVHKTLHALMGY